MSGNLATSTVIPSLLPSATSTPTPRSTNNSQSPLLFFVALGFGVLFTNLWIIIGVKYCFRYQSARRRGITLSQMNAEIAAANAQQRTGRRRREKKLMSIEEVNAQFPLQTYKAWRASREREGLSTEGGMQAVVDPERAVVARQEMQQDTAILTGEEEARVLVAAGITEPRTSVQLAASRRQSLQRGETYADETIYEVAASQPGSSTARVIDTGKSDKTLDVCEADIAEASTTTAMPAAAAASSSGQGQATIAGPADIDADGAIVSGDTCAICIDLLEEEDDIRGLTCGHAFHAACVDQWLTTRRAICPLCKKDFWVRKTPVAGESEAEGSGEVGPGHAERSGVLGALDDIRAIRLPRFGRGGARSAAETTTAMQDSTRQSRRSRRQGRTGPEQDLEQGREMTDLSNGARSGGTVFQPAHLAGVHATQR